MAQNKKQMIPEPWFDAATNLFRLKINKIILESDSRTYYYIRKNELQRINERLLPKSIKFVIQDETLYQIPEIVNIKVILERIDVQEFIVKFEESSEAKRWSSELAMNEYFESRIDQLKSRQSSVFDLVIQATHNDKKYFLIQYSAQIADVNNSRILKLIRAATENVHSSSENFDSSQFLFIN